MFVEIPNQKEFVGSASPFPELLVSRFTTAYSALAFPRDLGQSLDLCDTPRLHSFAWNTGTREERLPNWENRIFDLISLQDALHYSDIYFNEIHPVFGILDQTYFLKVCHTAWSLRKMPIDLEATICGAVALGSLFSPNSTPWVKEACVVEQAKDILVTNLSDAPCQHSLKFVLAWLLRAIYLRCTTRPELSWMATCNAMHIAEVIGLHQPFCRMDALRERPREFVLTEAAYRRRAFWIALSLNRLFSFEYGRSPIQLDLARQPLPEVTEDSDLTAEFVNLCQLLPRYRQDGRKEREEEDLAASLQHLAEYKVQKPFLVLLKADICFSIFRKMRFLHMDLVRPQTAIITSTIRTGLEKARELSHSSSKWWNVVSVPFHSVCTLIAMDNPASLALLMNAMEALRAVADDYDTHLAREALQTAEHLLNGCQQKKLEQAMWVGQALSANPRGKSAAQRDEEPLARPGSQTCSGFDWPTEDTAGLMEVFFDWGVTQ